MWGGVDTVTDDSGEYTAQEKAASVVWRLARGDEVKTQQVADEFSITIQGAYRLMNTVSRVVPICVVSTGTWRRFDID